MVIPVRSIPVHYNMVYNYRYGIMVYNMVFYTYHILRNVPYNIHIIFIHHRIWYLNTPLVGGWATYPTEKWWTSSVGNMTFPTEWKNNPNVPNHQPNEIRTCCTWEEILIHIIWLWGNIFEAFWSTPGIAQNEACRWLSAYTESSETRVHIPCWQISFLENCRCIIIIQRGPP